VVCTRPCKLLHLDVLEVLHSFFKCACVTIVDVTLTQELLDSQSGFGVATKLLQQLRHPVNQDAACTGLIELGESLLDTFDLILATACMHAELSYARCGAWRWRRHCAAASLTW